MFGLWPYAVENGFLNVIAFTSNFFNLGIIWILFLLPALLLTRNNSMPFLQFLSIFQQSPGPSRHGSVSDFTKPSDSASRTSVSSELVVNGEPQESSRSLFTSKTKAIIWGMQQRAVQGMLDFDYSCSRKTPSVVAMIYPFT